MYLEFRGVKSACSKGFEVFKYVFQILKNQIMICYSQFTRFAVLDYSGTHSLNAHTNCISNFNIRNRLFALTSFARQSLATLYRKSAFTLAETLIVMGIIGVVAALTLPNLNSSTGDKEKVAKVKKIYQNLNDAYGRATAVYGPASEWFRGISNNTQKPERVVNKMTEFMKVSKNCGTNITDCFPDKLHGTNSYWFYQSPDLTRTVTLADGTSIVFAYSSVNTIYAILYLDIDGKKGANTEGKDVFSFFIDDNGVFPAGHDITKSPTPCKVPNFDCATWVINVGNMDYLKTSDGKTCPNGTTILDGTTNTTCK